MGWLGDGSHRGQGCQVWTVVGLLPWYPHVVIWRNWSILQECCTWPWLSLRTNLQCTAASMAWHQPICRPICSASPMSAHGSDFALRRPRHWLAVARSVRQSVTVLLPLLHRPSGTASQKTYGHPHRCSCSDIGWSLNFSGVLWAQDTTCDSFLCNVTL